jgi:ribosomal protein S18 acetylase RimI-like enzyme
MEFRRFLPSDLPGVLRLCEQENWPSFPGEPGRANRALTAPGVMTIVAVECETVVGFAQLLSDGEIQAHLSLIVVDSAYRRRGIGKQLIVSALQEAGGFRIDLITDSAQGFYSSFPHVRRAGFRLYPNYRKLDNSN